MNDIKNFLENNFALQLNEFTPDSESAYLKYIHQELTKRIIHLIRVDLDKLTQALYRIDVSDRQTDAAFNLGEINQIADKLSELIIKRQLKKLSYAREFYKEQE
tara:strand:- start:55440 stop:55751 length:312 start_codon:yes stop_codon:yes gene_type:complete